MPGPADLRKRKKREPSYNLKEELKTWGKEKNKLNIGYKSWFNTRALHLNETAQTCFNTLMEIAYQGNEEVFALPDFSLSLAASLSGVAKNQAKRSKEEESGIKALRFESKSGLKTFVQAIIGFGEVQKTVIQNLLHCLGFHVKNGWGLTIATCIGAIIHSHCVWNEQMFAELVKLCTQLPVGALAVVVEEFTRVAQHNHAINLVVGIIYRDILVSKTETEWRKQWNKNYQSDGRKTMEQKMRTLLIEVYGFYGSEQQKHRRTTKQRFATLLAVLSHCSKEPIMFALQIPEQLEPNVKSFESPQDLPKPRRK